MSAQEMASPSREANEKSLKQGSLLLSIYGYAPCHGKLIKRVLHHNTTLVAGSCL